MSHAELDGDTESVTRLCLRPLEVLQHRALVRQPAQRGVQCCQAGAYRRQVSGVSPRLTRARSQRGDGVAVHFDIAAHGRDVRAVGLNGATHVTWVVQKQKATETQHVRDRQNNGSARWHVAIVQGRALGPPSADAAEALKRGVP